MQYAILCYHSEDVVCSWTKEEDDAVMAKLMVVQDKLVSDVVLPGKCLSDAPLAFQTKHFRPGAAQEPRYFPADDLYRHYCPPTFGF